MCIAIYSPKGTKVPCEEYLKTSFIHNDDGAGFAFNTDNRDVQIVKGLMTWDDFINTFRKYNKKYNFKNRGVLIHFRITTHGGTNKECCHPFPLTSDIAAMRKPVCHSKFAVIHNGIISLTSTDAWKLDKCSDTMVFISKYLSKIATNQGWFKNQTNWDLIYDLADSKIAVLNGKGQIMSTAGFTQDADGNWYSNSSYKEARPPKTTTYYYKGSKSCGGWYDDYKGWDDWGDWGDYYGGYRDYRTDDKVYHMPVDAAENKDLMRLGVNEFAIMDDESQMYSDDESYIYITEDGAVFIQDKEFDHGTYVNHPIYCGESYGVFSWSNMAALPFRKDTTAFLRPSDYHFVYEDEEAEEELDSDSELDSEKAKEKQETALTVYANQNK